MPSEIWRIHVVGRPLPGKKDGKEDLIEVAYTGIGFMLIKKGVFERLEYPWFKPIENKSAAWWILP
jgi:hypothetical protein